MPATAEDAVAIAESGALATAKTITVRHIAGEEYDRICGYELGEVPTGWESDVSTQALEEIPTDSIPF